MEKNKIRYKVLIVDDEKENCLLLTRMLRKNFETIYALSVEEALELLKKEEGIAVIITDMRMPGMYGDELLIQALQIQPLTVGIVITGYADTNAGIKAINEGHAVAYLRKPFEKTTLMTHLSTAINKYERKKMSLEMIERLRAVESNLKTTVMDILKKI